MLYLFEHHHVLPSQFERIPPGERVVLLALAHAEIENKAERVRARRFIW